MVLVVWYYIFFGAFFVRSSSSSSSSSSSATFFEGFWGVLYMFGLCFFPGDSLYLEDLTKIGLLEGQFRMFRIFFSFHLFFTLRFL